LRLSRVQSTKEYRDMLIGIAIGFVLGVVATVVYNHFFPAHIDKASTELV